jgi:hypothetical protein
MSFVLYSELSETTYPIQFQGLSWPLKMEPINCRETPVATTLHNVPEECRSRIRSTLLPNSFYPKERAMVYFTQQNLASGIRYVCPFENNRKSFVIWGRCWVGSEGRIYVWNKITVTSTLTTLWVVSALSPKVLAARVLGSTPAPTWLW